MANNDTVTRFFGGSPLAVLGRLILVSILVGVVLVGARPRPVRHRAQPRAAGPQSIWNMGFDAFRWLWRYLLLGAVIVIPIWLILRAGQRAARQVISSASSPPSCPPHRAPTIEASEFAVAAFASPPADRP